jgi:hypothetical protein
MFTINIWAVLVAGVANFIIGFLFHGPLFGKLWMRLANVHPTGNEKFKDMIPQMLKNLLVNIVFAYVLSVMYLFASTSTAMGTTGAISGMLVAFLVWIGFLVTSSSIEVIWMGRSYKLWLFEVASSLVCCLAMGAIIGAW